MQRIFGGPPDGDGAVTVTGQDAYHLARVLRMREGDEVILSDPAGRDHLCRIEAAAPDAVRLRAVAQSGSPRRHSAASSRICASIRRSHYTGRRSSH